MGRGKTKSFTMRMMEPSTEGEFSRTILDTNSCCCTLVKLPASHCYSLTP